MLFFLFRMNFSLLLVFCGAAFAASTGSPQNAMKTPENMMQMPKNSNATQATKSLTAGPINATQATTNATRVSMNATATKTPTFVSKPVDPQAILALTNEIGKLRGLVEGLEGDVSKLQNSNIRLESDELNNQRCDANWKSGKNTNGCKEYIVNEYCKKDGDHYGSNWATRWGTMEDWADEQGRTALVCPQCGCKATGKEMACITRHTKWDEAYSLRFLDRQNVDCGPGEVLQRLQFESHHLEGRGRITGRYEYECCVFY